MFEHVVEVARVGFLVAGFRVVKIMDGFFAEEGGVLARFGSIKASA